MRKKLSYYAFTLVALILLFQLLAFQFYWYYTVWWSDMAMHTAGGIFLALLIGIIAARHIQQQETRRAFQTILLWVLIIGVGWEIFEYIVQILFKPVPFANIPDSLSDIMCDILGGVIGAIFVVIQKRRYNSIHESKQEA
jgi:glycopeptide antibiotics resistance protein